MKKFLTILVMLAAVSQLSAQNSQRPWSFGMGMQFADFTYQGELFTDNSDGSNFQGGFGEIVASRYINRHFNLHFSTGAFKLDDKAEEFGGLATYPSFWNLDLDLHYKFLSSLMGAEYMVEPYVYAGLGWQNLSNYSDMKFQAGLGAEAEIWNGLAVYARFNYSKPFEEESWSYVSPHIGLKVNCKCGAADVEKDSDKDGIIDRLDACPTVKGTAANRGCPEVSQVDRAEIMRIAKSIYFDTGKDVIKAESITKLDELIVILKRYPALKLTVEGHTDDVGKDEDNLKLSQDRVNSVKKYLVSKGIEEGRISAIGYGETRPIVPNSSDENRAQNRRVELRADY